MHACTGWRRRSRLTSSVPFGILMGLVLGTFTGATNAHALKVAQAKGDSSMLTIESGDSPQVGDQYFVMIGGKKLGLVQITKVQGKRALAKKKKGRVEVGAELMVAKSSSGGGSRSHAQKRGRKNSGQASSDLSFGGLIGMNSVTQSVNSVAGAQNTSVSMAGSSYSVKAFGDLTISGGLGALARLGIENLNLAGSSNGVSYTTSIMYVSGDLLLRYNFDLGSFVPFAAAGMGIYMPMSKTSNALQDIPMTTVIFVNGGTHYNLSSTSYLTALVEYGLFPPSTSVSTTFLAVRGGMGFRF